jgi:aldose 1-epimerase
MKIFQQENFKQYRFFIRLWSQKCPSGIDTTFVLDSKEEFAVSLLTKKYAENDCYTDQQVHIYVGGNCFNEVKGKRKC